MSNKVIMNSNNFIGYGLCIEHVFCGKLPFGSFWTSYSLDTKLLNQIMAKYFHHVSTE